MDFFESLKSFTKDVVYKNYSLKNSCGYGVGGKAKYYVEPTSVVSLRTIVELSNQFNEKYKIIGNGTNVLLSDKGYNGLIICTKLLKGLSLYNNKVVCASGETLNSLINFCVKNGYTGIEQLCGIPATVGGAVVMNASAYGKTISDHVVCVDLLKDGKLLRIDKDDIKFGYRKSVFQELNLPILSVVFSFQKSSGKLESKELINYCSVVRKNNQPKGKSCGSVFRNTERYKAGELIDKVGLKGTSIGKARVSEKHANFIITEDGATANDVYSLIRLIKIRVKEKFNVELTEEIEYVGEF